jgi:hypothetical protein
MIAEASAAISGIKTAFEISKGISALKSETEINQAIIGIQRVLLDAQQAALEDKQRISDLTDRLLLYERANESTELWKLEKQRYVLTKSLLGAYTYDLRPEMANGEVLHRICATCVEAGRKSILHIRTKHSGGEIVFCQVCKSSLTLADFQVTIASY